MSTKLFTLCTGLPITKFFEGPRAAVFVTEGWKKDAKKLPNKEDHKKMGAKLKMLVSSGIDEIKGLAWFGSLQQRSGMMELRVDGLRYYGAVVGSEAGFDCVVLLGAEDKKGKSEANNQLLDRCESALGDIKAQLEKARSESETL